MKKDAKAPSMKRIPDKKIVRDDEVVKKNGEVQRTVDPRPYFSVNSEILPEIKDWSVGKEYPLEIRVVMTGSRIGEYGDDKGKTIGEFRVIGVMSDTDADDKGGKEKDDESPIKKAMKEEKY